MPARMNETITAGPASGTAADSTKKMPVPTVAPTPNIVSWKVPIRAFEVVGGTMGDRRTDHGPAPQHLLGEA